MISDWQILRSEANQSSSPKELPGDWQEFAAPGSVANWYLAQGQSPPEDIDNFDWWFSGIVESQRDQCVSVVFQGLAPLTEIWLNGELLEHCHSMFSPTRVQAQLKSGINRWHLCFRSLGTALKQRKPRPKWKTPLLDQQNLRWYRTSLMGRMACWNKAWPVIGPWAETIFQDNETLKLVEHSLNTRYEVDSAQGKLALRATIFSGDLQPCSAALKFDGKTFPLTITRSDKQHIELALDLDSLAVEAWWPHTHGEPKLYPVSCHILCEHEQNFNLDFGETGFKQVELVNGDGQHHFLINGEKVFCRGSVWTPQDPSGFSNNKARLAQSLKLARAAGVNMLRINGTMNYESEDFYILCSELGIMVWQDFMFANMDYPIDDENFSKQLDVELNFQISRLSKHVSLSAYCGSNEAYMQAVMLGIPKAQYQNRIFDDLLPGLCSKLHPGIPFMEGSPYGGELPFLPDSGTSHYYGVSAYMQPLSDAETSQVTFASECLAFSNIPEPSALKDIYKGKLPYTHDPLWKQGIPRMASAGWDFEDVRDFYLKTVYHCDPIALRYKDTPRYMELSRVLTGDIMSETLALWRSNYTHSSGALTWFWQDLYAGAGWGLLDQTGHPKAAWYCFKRACQPTSAFLVPRGLNGLFAVVINDSAQTKKLKLELKGFNHLDGLTFDTGTELSTKGNSQQKICIDTLIGHFTDLPHAFRFGPIQHQVVQACLYDTETDNLLSEHFYFPEKQFLSPKKHPDLAVTAEKQSEGKYEITLTSSSFVQWLRLDIAGFIFSDNYFHLAPGQQKVVNAQSEQDIPLKGYIEGINLQEAIRINCK